MRRLFDGDVLLQSRDLGFVDVFPDLAAELLDRCVRPVFLELTQHAWPHARDAENLLVAGGVEVDAMIGLSGRPGSWLGRPNWSGWN